MSRIPSPRTARTITTPGGTGLLVALMMILLTDPRTAAAQDVRPDPEDRKEVELLLRMAARAILEKDAKGFVACCDTYISCAFFDGTRVVGKTDTEASLNTYFGRRPKRASLKLADAPRNVRVLSPHIWLVDWPATLFDPDSNADPITVNTFTTVRKVEDRWAITAFIESVPSELPGQ